MLVIAPKTPELSVMSAFAKVSEFGVPGALKLGWFSALNASVRNFKLTLSSHSGNVLPSPRSTLKYPGPRRLLRLPI